MHERKEQENGEQRAIVTAQVCGTAAVRFWHSDPQEHQNQASMPPPTSTIITLPQGIRANNG